jgi:uncharacterized protein YidB (DUF937 family)
VGIEDILTKLGGQQGQAGGVSSIMKLFGGSKQGLQGLTSQLTSNGLADQVKSWVGHGQNESVSGSQIREAMDPAVLNQVAEQANMTPEQASESVAQVLPEMVNKATPDGQIPAEDPFAKGLGSLGHMFKS